MIIKNCHVLFHGIVKRHGIYVTLVNDRGKIVWVSDTLPGVLSSDVVGQDVWGQGSSATQYQVRDAFLRAISGEKVTHWSTNQVRTDLHYFRTVWRRAELPDGLLLVLTTMEVQPEFHRLSERQRSVLRAVVEYGSNEEAAKAFNLSERTVETHLRNIREIVGVRTRQGLLSFAIHHFADL